MSNSEGKLDQVVKGAPPPALENEVTPVPTSGVTTGPSPSDPLAALPSSPPQIYLNLLILEASLRAQYLELRGRRRQHGFFLTLLGLWIAYFGYALFFKPREDGSGVGGSVYWVVDMIDKMAFLGGLVTGILVWATGMWERGIRWPRRWVGITNRGLRGFNCKIVVVKRPWWREWIETLGFYLEGGLWHDVGANSYRYIDTGVISESEKEGRGALPNISEDDIQRKGSRGREEDLAPGGDIISLLLLQKPFSLSFRENWDLYRTDYWEKENERRTVLRQKIKAQDKVLLKKLRQQEGWLAPLQFWQRKSIADIEKSSPTHRQHSGLMASEKRRSGSHSRNSSRASSPTLEPEDMKRPSHTQRGSVASTASNVSTGSERRKKRGALSPSNSMTSSTSTRTAQLIPSSSGSGSEKATRRNSVTPDAETSKSKAPGSPLVRQNSFNSVSSLEIEKDEKVGSGSDSQWRKKKNPGGGPTFSLKSEDNQTEDKLEE